jgi:hypothetical protein
MEMARIWTRLAFNQDLVFPPKTTDTPRPGVQRQQQQPWPKKTNRAGLQRFDLSRSCVQGRLAARLPDEFSVFMKSEIRHDTKRKAYA